VDFLPYASSYLFFLQLRVCRADDSAVPGSWCSIEHFPFPAIVAPSVFNILTIRYSPPVPRSPFASLALIYRSWPPPASPALNFFFGLSPVRTFGFSSPVHGYTCVVVVAELRIPLTALLSCERELLFLAGVRGFLLP